VVTALHGLKKQANFRSKTNIVLTLLTIEPVEKFVVNKSAQTYKSKRTVSQDNKNAVGIIPTAFPPAAARGINARIF
jgi:hypothetical protein